VAVIALLVGIVLAALVWHATRLNPFDAWVLRGQERANAHVNEAAKTVSRIVPAGVTVVIMAASAALAWRSGRRDAVVLALTAAPAAFAAELLLKRLVHRQWNGEPALLFPSGHVAVATAAAMTLVLVLRVVPVATAVRVAAAYVCGLFVLVVAAARLVETVHPMTDIVGGVMTGLVVTLGEALAISRWSR